MLNVLVIRLSREREEDDDVKTGGEGREAADCSSPLCQEEEMEEDGWIDRQGKEDTHTPIIQRLVADQLFTVCTVSVVFLLMSAY